MRGSTQEKPLRVSLTKTIPLERNRLVRNLEDVYLTCRQSNLISKERQQAWWERVEEDPTIEMYGIAWDEEDKTSTFPDHDQGFNIIGTCGFTGISKDHGTAEYSLLIFPEYQGHGFAKASLRALLDFGFSNWSWLHLVWGEIMRSQEAGLHIALSLGFQEDAWLRERYFKLGSYVDTCIVSITRDEWVR